MMVDKLIGFTLPRCLILLSMSCFVVAAVLHRQDQTARQERKDKATCFDARGRLKPCEDVWGKGNTP